MVKSRGTHIINGNYPDVYVRSDALSVVGYLYSDLHCAYFTPILRYLTLSNVTHTLTLPYPYFTHTLPLLYPYFTPTLPLPYPYVTPTLPLLYPYFNYLTPTLPLPYPYLTYLTYVGRVPYPYFTPTIPLLYPYFTPTLYIYCLLIKLTLSNFFPYLYIPTSFHR